MAKKQELKGNQMVQHTIRVNKDLDEQIRKYAALKQQSISNVAKNELDKIEIKIKSNELNKEQAIDALRKLGDSFEKMNIIRLLREKYK